MPSERSRETCHAFVQPVIISLEKCNNICPTSIIQYLCGKVKATGPDSKHSCLFVSFKLLHTKNKYFHCRFSQLQKMRQWAMYYTISRKEPKAHLQPKISRAHQDKVKEPPTAVFKQNSHTPSCCLHSECCTVLEQGKESNYNPIIKRAGPLKLPLEECLRTF